MGFGKIFVLSAPSGAGKTTMVRKVLERCGKRLALTRAITYTTRPAREGEVNGVDYHFISIDEFKEKIKKSFFIEWSTWYDYYYGSPASLLEGVHKGNSYIMILDRQGAKEVKAVCPRAVLIWIMPPSVEVLQSRLHSRNEDSSAVIVNRLKKAAIEMEQEEEEHFYAHHIVNDNLETAVLELEAIFIQSLSL